MPVHLAKRGGKWCGVDESGKVEQCYSSRAEAVKYVRGKNMGIKRSEGSRAVPPPLKKKASAGRHR